MASCRLCDVIAAGGGGRRGRARRVIGKIRQRGCERRSLEIASGWVGGLGHSRARTQARVQYIVQRQAITHICIHTDTHPHTLTSSAADRPAAPPLGYKLAAEREDVQPAVKSRAARELTCWSGRWRCSSSVDVSASSK